MSVDPSTFRPSSSQSQSLPDSISDSTPVSCVGPPHPQQIQAGEGVLRPAEDEDGQAGGALLSPSRVFLCLLFPRRFLGVDLHMGRGLIGAGRSFMHLERAVAPAETLGFLVSMFFASFGFALQGVAQVWGCFRGPVCRWGLPASGYKLNSHP